MLVGFGRVPVFEATQSDTIVRVVTLWVDTQCEVVPGHCLLEMLLVLIAVSQVYHRVIVLLVLYIQNDDDICGAYQADGLPVGVDGTIELSLLIVLVALQVPKVWIVKIKSLQIFHIKYVSYLVFEFMIRFLLHGRLIDLDLA